MWSPDGMLFQPVELLPNSCSNLCDYAMLAGVVADSYIDDFLIVAVDNASIWTCSAQYCLNRIHTMLGMEFEPKRHKAAAPSQDF